MVGKLPRSKSPRNLVDLTNQGVLLAWDDFQAFLIAPTQKQSFDLGQFTALLMSNRLTVTPIFSSRQSIDCKSRRMERIKTSFMRALQAELSRLTHRRKKLACKTPSLQTTLSKTKTVLDPGKFSFGIKRP